MVTEDEIRQKHRNSAFQEIDELSQILVGYWEANPEQFQKGRYVRPLKNFSRIKSERELCMDLIETRGSGEDEQFYRVIGTESFSLGEVYVLSRESRTVLRIDSVLWVRVGAYDLSKLRTTLSEEVVRSLVDVLRDKIETCKLLGGVARSA